MRVKIVTTDGEVICDPGKSSNAIEPPKKEIKQEVKQPSVVTKVRLVQIGGEVDNTLPPQVKNTKTNQKRNEDIPKNRATGVGGKTSVVIPENPELKIL